MLSDSGPTGSSDISDVDLTNFPELDCGLNSRLVVGSDSCQMSRRHPELGIAGWHGESTAYPESTEGGRRVSLLKWPKGAPLNLG